MRGGIEVLNRRQRSLWPFSGRAVACFSPSLLAFSTVGAKSCGLAHSGSAGFEGRMGAASACARMRSICSLKFSPCGWFGLRLRGSRAAASCDGACGARLLASNRSAVNHWRRQRLFFRPVPTGLFNNEIFKITGSNDIRPVFTKEYNKLRDFFLKFNGVAFFFCIYYQDRMWL